jgi:pyruvate/2-oxoglutarate dehydrogenase complex dihydrolipoamide dehydrogenase (E3) component
MAHLQTTNPCRAVVIAGGYIGIEMAENLHERGLSTTLVEGASHILAPFDDEMAAIVQAHIKDKTSSCTWTTRSPSSRTRPTTPWCFWAVASACRPIW